MIINIDLDDVDSSFLFLLLVFLVFLVLTANFENGRLTGVFGPNMLYRFFAVGMFLFFLFSKLSFYKVSSFFSMVAMLMTGSATVNVYLSLLIYNFLKNGRYFILTIFFLLPFIFYFGAFLERLTIVQRVIYKLENLESIDRFLGWRYIMETSDFVGTNNFYDYYVIWSEGFMYPHNIFVETIAYYGVFGWILVMSCIFSVWLFFSQKRTAISYIFMVVFIASLFSGDLSDNYAVYVLSFYFVTRHFVQARQSEGRVHCAN
jgi:hypothetical protein